MTERRGRQEGACTHPISVTSRARDVSIGASSDTSVGWSSSQHDSTPSPALMPQLTPPDVDRNRPAAFTGIAVQTRLYEEGRSGGRTRAGEEAEQDGEHDDGADSRDAEHAEHEDAADGGADDDRVEHACSLRDQARDHPPEDACRVEDRELRKVSKASTRTAVSVYADPGVEWEGGRTHRVEGEVGIEVVRDGIQLQEKDGKEQA